ncbi:MAG: hypothetical protein U0838_07960 [Chloroflexota bacterium]
MARATERIFELMLVLLAVVLAALGATGAIVAALAIGGCLLLLAVFGLVRTARSRLDRRTAAVQPPSAADAPSRLESATAERDRLLRQGAEAPQKRAEREELLRDARQVARTYRAMAAMHGIADTDPDSRAQWLDRVIALHRRLGDYAERWQVSLPDASTFVPLVPPVQPDWLEGMARDADAIAWQVDHEDRAEPIGHEVAAVGGTRITCTCGRTFTTSAGFDAHVARRG